MPIISEQVKIFLERMDLCPEEFVKPTHLGMATSSNKWEYVLQSGEFNIVEQFFIKRKIKSLRRNATKEVIMSTIMHDNANPQKVLDFDTLTRVTNNLTNMNRKEKP